MRQPRLARENPTGSVAVVAPIPGDRLDLIAGNRVAGQMATVQLAHSAIPGLSVGLVLRGNRPGGPIRPGAALAGVAFVP